MMCAEQTKDDGWRVEVIHDTQGHRYTCHLDKTNFFLVVLLDTFKGDYPLPRCLGVSTYSSIFSHAKPCNSIYKIGRIGLCAWEPIKLTFLIAAAAKPSCGLIVPLLKGKKAKLLGCLSPFKVFPFQHRSTH